MRLKVEGHILSNGHEISFWVREGGLWVFSLDFLTTVYQYDYKLKRGFSGSWLVSHESVYRDSEPNGN